MFFLNWLRETNPVAELCQSKSEFIKKKVVIKRNRNPGEW